MTSNSSTPLVPTLSEKNCNIWLVTTHNPYCLRKLSEITMTPSQTGLFSKLGETVVSVVHFAKQQVLPEMQLLDNLGICVRALNSISVRKSSIKMRCLRAKPCSLLPSSSNLNPLNKYSPCKIQLTLWIISKCLLPSNILSS